MPFAKENARDGRKRGLRRKGRLSPSNLSLRELARMLITDPMVQKQILKQARAGTLPPRVLLELVRYGIGPPPSEPEPPPPPDRNRDDLREQMARLTTEEVRQLADLNRKMLGRDLQAPSRPEP
jgi:hypothetical protein